jgi:hypothetical protein
MGTAMTLQALIEKWKDEVANWDVKNLWLEAEFMADSFNWPEFAAYLLRVRPDLRHEKARKIKFLGLRAVSKQSEVKPAHVEPVAPDKLSKTGQIMKDLKEYKKKQGFI